MSETPKHLLSSLGVLASFSISKKVSKEEVDKLTKKVKKAMTESNPDKFQKMLMQAVIENTKKYINKEMPPGLTFPEANQKKNKLDRFYMELSAISHAISQKFIEQKFSKHQICFIINAVVNILGIAESDFEEFHRKYSEYKENNSDDDDGEEE